MAFRSGNNRRSFGGGNYGGGGGMGGMGRMNPWDNQNTGGGNFVGMRQGGGGGGGGGQGMNAEALTLANNLLNNLLRNQNPPSLLDLPRGGGGAGGLPGNRGPRPVSVGNRAGNRNRRVQGGFGRGQKSGSNKQGGIRKQNAFDRAKKLLAKNATKKKDSSPGDKTDKKKNESVKEKESIYADVPNDMFYCHLCKKHMWDSNSFENHIKGRTHLMMREGIEESYRLKANMIRQEAKIAEQLKLIELDRLKRMGKSGKAQRTEYCTMCDLNFHGHISAHRKSEGHLSLKRFLHPKCNECNREFPTRIEYDTHLLTPEHLKKAAERNTKVGERKKKTLLILTEEDELKDVKQPTKKKKKVEPKKEGEEDEKKENGEAAAEGDEEKKEGEEGGEEEGKDDDEANQIVIEDPEDVIIDYRDGEEIPAEVDSRIPKYNWLRPVGSSLISKLECYECSICAKFFDNDKTADVHARTISHHRSFVRFINDKSSDTKIAQKRAAAALEENERKKRKLEAATGEEDAANTSENVEEDKPSDELYDPSEATGEGEDEDVEMNENEEQQEEGDEADESKEENKDEVNGKVEDAAMKEDEVKKEEQDAEMAEPEPEPEKPVETKKEEKPAAAKPATPQKTAAATPQKGTPAARGGAQAKGTPRGRGRGRYNRF